MPLLKTILCVLLLFGSGLTFGLTLMKRYTWSDLYIFLIALFVAIVCAAYLIRESQT